MAKGLGKGMGALFGEETMREEPASQRKLPVAKIEPRRGQPRENFDPEKLQELAESIQRHGMIQPITVRPIENGFYQIIAGERRWRAARLAGLTEVPVSILEADEQTTAELALIENLQREDLNPMEEARGYKKLMESFSLTQEQVAERVGRSRPVVTNAMRLLKLSDGAAQLVESGELSLSHARAILEIADPEAQTNLAQMAVRDGLSVRQVTDLAKKLNTKPRKPRTKKNPRLGEDGVDYMAELEAELSRRLGRRVRIDAAQDDGCIKIDYYNKDDFERLIKALRTLKEVRE